ncbi:hypothetical protein C4J81_10220 [Deltaproteobacteria bacterium Smac51]|nr:hypothetical protein C4J81_10220 [Deltaproteobacteria bacterium Smac51]
MEVTLNIVKRSLAALDRLEDSGVGVNLIRADLSTVADRLEIKIRAGEFGRRLDFVLDTLGCPVIGTGDKHDNADQRTA